MPDIKVIGPGLLATGEPFAGFLIMAESRRQVGKSQPNSVIILAAGLQFYRRCVSTQRAVEPGTVNQPAISRDDIRPNTNLPRIVTEYERRHRRSFHHAERAPGSTIRIGRSRNTAGEKLWAHRTPWGTRPVSGWSRSIYSGPSRAAPIPGGAVIVTISFGDDFRRSAEASCVTVF